MTARRLSVLLLSVIVLSLLLIPTVSAQISKSPVDETDFARDVRVGVEETRNNSTASSLQTLLLDNEIVGGKSSTTQGVFDVEVIQSMDEDSLNKEFTTKEEQTGDMKTQNVPPIMMKGN